MTAAAPRAAATGSSPIAMFAPAARAASSRCFARLQFARAGDFEPEVEPRRGVDPGRQHVVVVARPGDLAAADRTALLLERHQVGQHLAGMRLLGEAVDDRNRRVRRHFPHVVLAEDSNDDRVDIARQHARGVGDGLAAPELHLGPGQHDRFAAELAHPDVERDAGAGRRPVEDHRQRLAGERTPGALRALDPRRLHRRRGIEDAAKLAARKLEQIEEMPRSGMNGRVHGFRFSSSPPSGALRPRRKRRRAAARLRRAPRR